MQYILIKLIFNHTSNNIIKKILNILPWKNIDCTYVHCIDIGF